MDEAIMRLVDFFLAVPFMMVDLVAVVVFGASLGLVIVLMTVFQLVPLCPPGEGGGPPAQDPGLCGSG